MANEVPSEPEPSQQQAPQRKPSERERYYVFVREYRGEYVTSQACRLLLKYVKEYIAKPLLMRHKTVEDVTRKVLDRFAHQRIDLDVLEKYELVARNPEYGVGATGDEFGYSSLLDEKIIDGEPMALVEGDPSWVPVANIKKSALKKFRDKKRTARKLSRRAQTQTMKAREKK